MSAKMCRVSNYERRPVVIRGCSGANFHLAPLETGREIRALELEGNPMVDKLKRRNVLGIEEVRARAKPKPKPKPKSASRGSKGTTVRSTKNTSRKKSSRRAGKSGSSSTQ